jgi:hypothetical protein
MAVEETAKKFSPVTGGQRDARNTVNSTNDHATGLPKMLDPYELGAHSAGLSKALKTESSELR